LRVFRLIPEERSKGAYRVVNKPKYVPFTVPLSNSLTASLINLYKLKKVLHLAGLTSYNGIPIDNPNNNNPFQLPQGD